MTKIPTQTVDLSQVLAKCIRQQQTQIIRSFTKNWDKNTITDLEPRTGLSQTRPRTPFKVLIVKDNFIQIDNISVMRHLVLNAQNS